MYEEHGHDVGDKDEGGGGIDGSHSIWPDDVLVHTEVQKYKSGHSKEKHEVGGEALNDVLSIDTSRQEDDRSYYTSMGNCRLPIPGGSTITSHTMPDTTMK